MSNWAIENKALGIVSPNRQKPGQRTSSKMCGLHRFSSKSESCRAGLGGNTKNGKLHGNYRFFNPMYIGLKGFIFLNPTDVGLKILHFPIRQTPDWTFSFFNPTDVALIVLNCSCFAVTSSCLVTHGSRSDRLMIRGPIPYNSIASLVEAIVESASMFHTCFRSSEFWPLARNAHSHASELPLENQCRLHRCSSDSKACRVLW